jgi:transposase-like protein
MMEVELTQYLGREPYERTDEPSNHRHGSYGRQFTLKGIGKVDEQVPRDRQGAFQTQVIPRSKPYEDQLRQDLSLMFLTGISTRTLSIMSTRLIGRRVSPTEVSNANKELINAVEQWRQRDLSRERIKYMLAFISLKIELSWRSSPVGKVRKNLPQWQAENFTHTT